MRKKPEHRTGQYAEGKRWQKSHVVPERDPVRYHGDRQIEIACLA